MNLWHDWRNLTYYFIIFQDSGQRCSTASLDIVTADAFSIILDYLYSGRLALNRTNVIEVMSAASYLQMTDLVNFCKEYIRSSLEIFNKEKEKKREKDNQEQDRTAGPDSGTADTIISNDTEAVEPHSQVAEAERGSRLLLECETSGRTSLPVPVTTTPCKSRNIDGDYHSKKEYDSGAGGKERQTNHASSSPALTPELVNPKIEYDPDEELIQSPDNKDLALYPAPAINNCIHSRRLPSSPSPSNERSPLGYSPSFNSARQLMDIVSRSEGPSLLMDRLGHRFNHSLINSTGGRLDESVGLVGSSMLEIQSDWLGEDAGN